MADDELRHFVDSNARTAQAMLDAMAETRMEREELREGTQRVQAAIERLIILQEGVSNMLAALDEGRPTTLRRLNSIERKIDRLLEIQRNEEN
ncbi:MAG: hypothetical protein AAFW84_31020 [Cyanobacteria bacterium J06635_15]